MKNNLKLFFYFYLQVHTFYKNCNGIASCNCAVAVRSGDVVILLNKCQEKKIRNQYLLQIQMFRSEEGLIPGTAIYRLAAGNRYEVTFENKYDEIFFKY